MEQYIISIQWDLLPTTGRDNIRDPVEAITGLYLLDTLIAGRVDQFSEVVKHLILPGIALATIPMAIIARMTRSSMLEVMRSDFIRTARAKGMRMFWVVYKHSLKNAINSSGYGYRPTDRVALRRGYFNGKHFWLARYRYIHL